MRRRPVIPFKVYDGPFCFRELRPGVERIGHKLTDHVDYETPQPTQTSSEIEEVSCPNE